MKNLIVTLIGMCFVLVSCSPQPTEVRTIDIHGYKYRLVSVEKQLGPGMTQSELWERIEPLDTNHWYTPTLSSKVNSNSAPMFNSLMR
jgi:hypothetical protein